MTREFGGNNNASTICNGKHLILVNLTEEC